jgi:hypothetical protein
MNEDHELSKPAPGIFNLRLSLEEGVIVSVILVMSLLVGTLLSGLRHNSTPYHGLENHYWECTGQPAVTYRWHPQWQDCGIPAEAQWKWGGIAQNLGTSVGFTAILVFPGLTLMRIVHWIKRRP